MFDLESNALLDESLRLLEREFAERPAFAPDYDLETVRATILETAARLGDNYPYAHPLYAGQMLKPPHPVARIAYSLALHLNPNNHALDGGRASSAMEKESVAEIAAMFGWGTHLGHLCGGGTMANLEALWVARESIPGEGIAASAQAHYTHRRLCGLLSVPFFEVPIDSKARMSTAALEQLVKSEKIGTVVATLGTTATGSVDPLPEILRLSREYGFRVHIDAAYGGYFTLAENLANDTRSSFDRIAEADSVVIDPHKHGLQPYGCGCVLFRDPAVGRVYRHDSPYTYFTSNDLHLGEISLECSRPGASAVALWATQRLLPLDRGGEFARSIEACRCAALDLYGRITSEGRFVPLLEPELDIVVWGVRAASASQASLRARTVFESAAKRNLHLALASLPRSLLEHIWPLEWDQEHVTCLRSCLLKPEHRDWLDAIWTILDRVA